MAYWCLSDLTQGRIRQNFVFQNKRLRTEVNCKTCVVIEYHLFASQLLNPLSASLKIVLLVFFSKQLVLSCSVVCPVSKSLYLAQVLAFMMESLPRCVLARTCIRKLAEGLFNAKHLKIRRQTFSRNDLFCEYLPRSQHMKEIKKIIALLQKSQPPETRKTAFLKTSFYHKQNCLFKTKVEAKSIIPQKTNKTEFLQTEI
jgi:hypothetical protein